MEFQTRSEETGIRNFRTLTDAFMQAHKDISVWKISFTLPTGERVRLVSENGKWIFEAINLDN